MPPLFLPESQDAPTSTNLAFRHHRVQQVLEPEAPEHFSPHAIRDTVDDFGPVLGGINVHAKRPLADLAAGSLFEVLPAHRPSPTPVSLLYLHRRQLSLRVRVFIDWLVREFAKHPEVSVTEQ